MGTTFTPGQLAQLLSNINIGIATVIPKVAEKYDPKVLLKALDGHGKIFAGHLETALEQALNKMFVLAPRSTTTVTLAERHDPNGFYQTRSGLYVWYEFRQLVVVKAWPIEAGSTFKVESFDLKQDLADEGIEGLLPKAHLFDETQCCGVVAGLIAAQPNGEEGALVNNGFANLFCLRSCIVRMRWNADDSIWGVSTWERDRYRWSAGIRVFSLAN